MKWLARSWFAAGVMGAACWSSAPLAQIRTDSSLGRAGQALAGPRFTIPEALGSLRGTNLFHSFAVFNIATGESATFTTATRGIGNIVSRVTGGDSSLINGTLRLTPADGTPAFYFINPAGVTFGAGAALDVPGAFHVSTADYVKFADGIFYANPSAASSLSSAALEAFGFLGANRGAINVENGARLSAGLMQPFSFSAGDISLDNGRVTTVGGDIRVVALGGIAQEVRFQGELRPGAGDLRIVNGGQFLTAAGNGVHAGSMAVRAGEIFIDRQGSAALTGILSQANSGTSGNAGAIDVAAAGDIHVIGGALISSATYASGNAGTVRVTGANVTLDRGDGDGFAGINSIADAGTGHAGTVTVTTPGLLSVLNGASILSNTNAAGNAASVSVQAGDILLDGRGRTDYVTAIASNADPQSSGGAGTVAIDTTRRLAINNGGQISSSTFSRGDAQSVRVNADSIVIDRQGSSYYATGIFSVAAQGRGNAGAVDVTARSILLSSSGGDIASSTFSEGNAGRVRVEADFITIDGMGDTFGAITSSARRGSSGNAGSVEVTARQMLLMQNGGEISSNTASIGNAGQVKVSAANLTIREDADYVTGIFSQAVDGTGNAGDIDVSVSGSLLMMGGSISSSAYAGGDAGEINVRAGSLRIDGQGREGFFVGIASQAESESSGNAGTITVSVSGDLTLANGGGISSSTFATGAAGSVSVAAGNIAIEGGRNSSSGIFSQANEDSRGDAGRIEVSATGTLLINEGGRITSSTYGAGNAGTIAVSAGGIVLEGVPGFTTGILSQAERGSSGHGGTVEVNADGRIVILSGAGIVSSTFSSGNAGSVSVRAGELLVDGRGIGSGVGSLSSARATGNAGATTVDVAGDISLIDGGRITSSTSSPAGNAGPVHVSARNILIDGTGNFGTGILSQTNRGTTGRGGSVEVHATSSITVLNAGVISTGTFGSGDAGPLKISADTILIDALGHTGTMTGIGSATVGGIGHGGSIEVTARELAIVNGGEIASGTFAEGDAGTIRVNAENITIDGRGSFNFTGIFTQAETGSSGNAGTIDINASGNVSIRDYAVISSATNSSGNAGSINVRARNLEIEGVDPFFVTGILSRAQYAGGNAGSVVVIVPGDVSMARGGLITSDAGDGLAGMVRVDAGNITISGADTAISSRAGFLSLGAGTVEVKAAGNLHVLDGGSISSSTSSYQGGAGSVRVTARDLVVDGRGDHGASSINARADYSSGGQTGNVTVNASHSITVSNGGELSITNDAVPESPGQVRTLLSVAAPVIALVEGGTITAASSFNMAASNIHVDVGSRMTMTDSSITTSAVSGDGGSITVTGPGALALRNSYITTSVTGLFGNGGDISIGTAALVMDTGFIQANTAAVDATGGNVAINVGALVPSGGSLFVGGQDPLEFRAGAFGLNVIQAAAPTGVSGAISVTTPALDISAGLVGLSAKVLDTGGLGRSLCEMTGGSSLAQGGRGGMPPSSRDFARVESAGGPLPLAMAFVDRAAMPRFACWR